MLTCHDVVELVTDYLEGALPTAREREVRQHLSRCSGCLRYLAQIQLTARLLAALRSEP
jgi:anti-sigma factor RsiW